MMVGEGLEKVTQNDKKTIIVINVQIQGGWQ